jgi:hypothetical protein
MASLETFDRCDFRGHLEISLVLNQGAPPRGSDSLSILVQNVERFLIAYGAINDDSSETAYQQEKVKCKLCDCMYCS